jgi:hypothetical protein
MQTHRREGRVLIAALAFAVVSSTAAWAAPPPPVPTECSLIGTWMGEASGDLVWWGIHTAGTRDKNGEMMLDWVYADPGLIGDGYRLGPGRGVWEQTTKGHYNYTWYAYGYDNAGSPSPVYTVKVHGTAENTDCNSVRIEYIFEMFMPPIAPWEDTSLVTPVGSTSGVAHEYRVLVTP